VPLTVLIATEEAICRPEDGIGAQLSHAAVVAQRADSLLTGTTGHRLLEVHRQRVICPSPGDVRRPEKADHRHAEGRGEMPRAGIRRHQQRRAANARLGEADAQGKASHATDPRMTGEGRDASRRVLLGGTTNDQHMSTQLIGQAASQDANDSSGQFLAGPKAPPVLRQTTNLAPTSPCAAQT